jgi:hypothetical protein
MSKDLMAIFLFKEYSLLLLKSFLIQAETTGVVNDQEVAAIKKAMQLHRLYNSYKIKQTKKKDESISKED